MVSGRGVWRMLSGSELGRRALVSAHPTRLGARGPALIDFLTSIVAHSEDRPGNL